MIAANVPGSAAGGATARAIGGATEAARDRGGEDSEFAGLMTGPAAAPAGRPSTAPETAEAGAGGEAEDDATADTPGDPMLPEQLLALLATWPAAARASGSATSAPASATGASPLPATPGASAATLPATSAAPTMAAAVTTATATSTSTAISAATAGTDTPLAPVPTASGDAGPAASLAGATPPSAAATGAGNADAITSGDFAKALGLAAIADAAASASAGSDTTTAPEVGDRGSLLAPTTSAATPMRAAAAAAVNPVLTLPADPDAGFDDAFGARIGWLADQRIGRAEIRLNPEHLGAIDVRLQIDGTRVSAEFQSPHADVRQALENSVGRLRELLGQQGLQLAQSDVGHGRGGEHGDRAASTRGGNPEPEHEAGLIERPLPQTLHSRGLLDEYA